MGKTKTPIVTVSRKNKLVDRMRNKIALKNGGKTLCLVMIVKNESANMVRLLTSLQPILDYISIVDTGSTDNTIEIIQNWGNQHSIPTTVHTEPFVNFEYNRTHSVKMAKKTYPHVDYLLLSDADFIWNINTNGTFDKMSLTDDKYYVQQVNSSGLTYDNIRLLRNKVDWICEGVTHECWTSEDPKMRLREDTLKTLMIDDREDGGCKSDKLQRDERLLRAGLDNPRTKPYLIRRYKFYLAQTLRDAGKHLESIEFYKKRAREGGWEEEVYYSHYQIGRNYHMLLGKIKYCITILEKDEIKKTESDYDHLSFYNPDDRTIPQLESDLNSYIEYTKEYYLKAYNYRKTRAESIYHLVQLLREINEYREAYNYACIGQKIPLSKDRLFVESCCYDYGFDSEIAMIAHNLPDKIDIGKESLCRLLLRNDLPPYIKNQIDSCVIHYNK